MWLRWKIKWVVRIRKVGAINDNREGWKMGSVCLFGMAWRVKSIVLEDVYGIVFYREKRRRKKERVIVVGMERVNG